MIVSDGMDGIMPHIMHIIRRNMLGMGAMLPTRSGW